MAFLFNVIISFVLGMIDGASGSNIGAGIGVVSGLYVLIVLIPGIALSIRRLHDTGRSGWWLFLSLVPIIGSIIVIVWLVRDGEAGDNRYGPSPKMVGSPA